MNAHKDKLQCVHTYTYQCFHIYTYNCYDPLLELNFSIRRKALLIQKTQILCQVIKEQKVM